MELRDYLRLLSKSWLLIVSLTILGGLVGGGIAAVQRPVYQATAKAFVSTPTGTSLADLSAGAGFLQTALKGYADLATTAYVLRPVIQQERLGTTSAELASRIQVTAASQEAMLQVTVGDDQPARAARIANAVTAQLSQAVVDLTPAGGTRTSAGAVQLTQVDPALTPTSATSPQPLLSILLGALAGLVAGVLVALLRELLDTRVRDRDDLARVTDAPLLGSTTRSTRSHSQPLALLDLAAGADAEEYRTIRTNLRFVQLDPENRSIVVSSPSEREGKSTTAANLALAMARLGERVLLIDADLRRPRIAGMFGLDGTVGLSDVVIGAAEAEQAIQHVAAGPIDVLPSGAVPPNPNELLQSKAMDDLFVGVRGAYDLVIIDSPPLLPVSDAVVLGTLAGGTLIVSSGPRSRRAHLQQALGTLDRAGVHVLGVVLTMLPGRPGRGYGYAAPSTKSASQPSPAAVQSEEGRTA